MRGTERENAAMIPVLSMIMNSSPLHTEHFLELRSSGRTIIVEVLQTHMQLGGEVKMSGWP